MRRARKIAEFIKLLREIEKNWPVYTQDNTGVFYNRIHLHTRGGSKILTKREVNQLIDYNKENLRKLLNDTAL